MLAIEVVPVGREILTGRIQESNANWIAKRILALGQIVRRITVIDDDRDTLAQEVRAAAARKTDLLIITGGLGPTFDDVTLAGLADGAGVKLELHTEARAFVAKKYLEYFELGQVPHSELTPEREKMAMLPVGSAMLANATGAAPGVHFKLGFMEIFALPGPPGEMRPIFLDQVEPIVAKIAGKAVFAEATCHTDSTDESVLTPLCRELTESISGLHAKTNPTFFGDEQGLLITLSVWCSSAATCDHILAEAKRRLEVGLPKSGVKITYFDK